jgi:endonuclease/exonuclease/phosphatase (EEP) superfamily protein YafD
MTAALGTGAATLLGFAGGWWWWADLASHFRVQYLAGSALLSIVALLARQRVAALALGCCAVVNAAAAAPALLSSPPSSTAGTPLRVVSVNVHTRGRSYDRVSRFLRRADADVVLLMEVDEEWLAALSHRFEGYHAVERPRPDNFGIALYTRVPCRDCRVIDLGEGVPSVAGDLQVGERTVRLVGTHPLPPVTAANAAAHERQMEALAAWLGGDSVPHVLVGDLNTTPFSARYRALLRRSGLVPSAGLRRTWPAGAWPLGIHIDHLLVSPGVGVESLRTGPDVGSDHYPLVAVLRIGG